MNKDIYYERTVDAFFESLISEVEEWKAKKKEPQKNNPQFAYQSVNLRARAFNIFDAGEFKGDELKTLISIFGRDRIVSIFKQWKEERHGQNTGESNFK